MKPAVHSSRLPVALLLAAQCFLLAPVSRGADGAPPPLDKRLRAEVIDGTCAELERTYVEADTAKLIANVLRQRLTSGAYDQLTDRNLFAQAVTNDLRSLNGDLHLSLRPAGAGGRPGGATLVVRGGPGPGGPGPP